MNQNISNFQCFPNNYYSYSCNNLAIQPYYKKMPTFTGQYQSTKDNLQFTNNVYCPPPVQAHEEKSFLEKHWGELLVGAALVIGIVASHGKLWGKTSKAVNPKTSTPTATPTSTTEIPKTKIFGTDTTKLQQSELDDFAIEANRLKNNNLQGLDIVANLSPSERKEFLQAIIEDMDQFALMATGNKPAVWTSTASTKKLRELASKIKSDKYDIIFANGKDTGALILDKKLVKNIIKENSEVFRRRLNLKDTSTVDDIYTAFTDPNNSSTALNGEFNSDLLGLTLGFPKNDTLLWNIKKKANIIGGVGENISETELKTEI